MAIQRAETFTRLSPRSDQWASVFQGVGYGARRSISAYFKGWRSWDYCQSIDYLSSVSGGGYIHEFLAGWILRNGKQSTVMTGVDSTSGAGMPAQSSRADPVVEAVFELPYSVAGNFLYGYMDGGGDLA